MDRRQEITAGGREYLQFLDELLQVALGGLGNDIEHFLADGADLAGLGVAGGAGKLVALLLGESNTEYTEVVSIGGAHINEGLDKGLPLADEGAQLVAGHVHAVEVGEAIHSLDVLHHQADLSVSLGLVASVEVGKAGLEHTALKSIGSNFY